MARKKKTKEVKKVSSLEVVTETEKHFLNLCRNFRCEAWLVDLISDNIEDIVCTFTERSVTLDSLKYLITEKEGELDESNVVDAYDQKSLELHGDEEYISNMSDFWYEKIMEAITGDLVPPDEA